MTVRLYRLGDVAIRVSCGTLRIAAAAEMLLGLHRSAEGDAASARLCIEVNLDDGGCGPTERQYPEAPALFVYDVARGYREGEAGLLVTDGYSELRVPDARRLEGVIRAPTLDNAYLFAVITLNLALQACLRAAGLFYTHAAALWSPAGPVLLAGDSRAGKTTLALALAQAGWRFISDDAVFLQPVDGRVQLAAFRRPIHLSAATRALFPQLGALARGPIARSRQVWDLDPHQAFPGQVADAGGPPAALVLLEADPSTSSSCEPIDAAVAIEGLLRQSAIIMMGGRSTQAHLDALASTVRLSANYRLVRGQDAHGRPETLVRLIDVVLSTNGASKAVDSRRS